MNRRNFFSLFNGLVLVVGCGAAPARPAAADEGRARPVVAISTLRGHAGPGGLGTAITDKVGAALLAKGNFRILERAGVDMALEEVRKQNLGLTDPETAKQIGKQLNADFLIYGEINGCQFSRSPRGRACTATLQVTFRCTEVESGELIADINSSADGTDVNQAEALSAATEEAANEFAKAFHIPVKGEVVLVQSDSGRFVINRGADDGVGKGDFYRVVRLGGDIKDPRTGLVIGHMEDEVCWGRVLDTQAGVAFLEAGEYSKNAVGQWKWKTRKEKLTSLQPGDHVVTAKAKTGGGIGAIKLPPFFGK